ncbi:uncharacterized protein LOC117242238 [Bombus vosnesenskii]|uniref:Uncharacterized protein LOC117242238 n=1 Tax=Bombus vosnesenskii TaxID=207650 RepID=A0A6J3LL45_9HYME|nr:uncharacterized protein LOC117242238 [Bombus vosnesenskii]
MYANLMHIKYSNLIWTLKIILKVIIYNLVKCNSSMKEFFQREELKEQNDGKRIQENKNFRILTVKEKELNCEDDRKKGGELENTILGFCAICLENINSNVSQNVPCSNEHTLCQRCIQHFALQSDPGCILCYTQCQQSNMNLLQESNISLNSTYTHMKKMQISQQESDYYSKHHQRLRQYDPINIEQLYTKSWNQNYSHMLQNFDRNTLTYYHNDFEDTSDYEQVRNQNNTSGERSRNCDKEKQRQSYCNLFKRRNVESYMLEAKVNGQITAECSRRPIRCPRIDCAINVAFSALTHHFIFDHPEVPILNVEPGIKSTLIVSFSALSSNTSRCLALLLVSGKLSEPIAKLFNGSQINPKYRNRLPLSVLAARLHCTDQYISNEKINKKKDFHEKNIIIAWVAGLDIGNTTDKLLCSIQAVDKIDNEGLRCLTYTGPVNSLRTAQCPQDIYSTGDCIVLHEGLLSHITSDCATLNVNVTVH